VRVITVYAAAAFVILELVDIITEPFGLPDWTLQFAIVFLCIGFIIAIILSWIYDMHPEGGIVKTEPAQEVNDTGIPKSSNNWKVASYISFVVIIGLVVFHVVAASNRTKERALLDKSIAVLPFRNDSPDEEKMYFINGTMEAILDNLCKIEDLRVPGRTSVEQYRNVSKPIPDIAEEMNVSYILEGSGQKLGNRILLTIQLLDGKNDQHLWSKQYDREIQKVEDLIDIQSEVAQLVAAEIEAIITPEEQQRIEKIPTSQLIAWELYQKGMEEYRKFFDDSNDSLYLMNAEQLYRDALDDDPTFALAYIGLARSYWSKYYWKDYFKDNFLDSVRILAKTALSFDPELPEGYRVLGDYYRQVGKNEAATTMYQKVASLNPNDWRPYYWLSRIYFNSNPLKAIENGQKALELNPDTNELPKLLSRLGNLYCNSGFLKLGYQCFREKMTLDWDSVNYYNNIMMEEWVRANYEKSLEFARKSYSQDSTNYITLMFLGGNYSALGYLDEAQMIFEKYLDRINELERPGLYSMHRVAYSFWQKGMEKEADHYFDLQMDYCIQMIKLGRAPAIDGVAYYDLACVYAFRGEHESAIEQLRIFNQRPISDGMVSLIKSDPLLDKIRNEPEFQQIVRDVEAKYQAEHERVRKWLEENDML
jgi:TolB-like protein